MFGYNSCKNSWIQKYLERLASITFRRLNCIQRQFIQQATCPELSPNYAGTLNGLVNGMGNTMGFVSPLIVAAIVEGNVSSQIVLTCFQSWIKEIAIIRFIIIYEKSVIFISINIFLCLANNTSLEECILDSWYGVPLFCICLVNTWNG